jgi:hypothetical protein
VKRFEKKVVDKTWDWVFTRDMKKTALAIGTKVKMTSLNSNWNVGETGVLTFIGEDRVGVYFPSRGDSADDDYTAFMDAFEVL